MKLLHGISALIRTVAARPRPKTAAVVLAGGSGTRMRGEEAKQWLLLGGHPVLWHTLTAWEKSDYTDDVVVVCRPEDRERIREMVRSSGFSKVCRLVNGGCTRQRSAYNGARCVPAGTRFIALHDAARCLVTPEEIDAVISRAYAVGAASLGIPIRDTVKEVDSNGYITGTLDRDSVFLAATPQVFSYPMYISAATSALQNAVDVTDDNMLMESLGQRVALVTTSATAMKLTVPEDIPIAESLLAAREKKAGKGAGKASSEEPRKPAQSKKPSRFKRLFGKCKEKKK